MGSGEFKGGVNPVMDLSYSLHATETGHTNQFDIDGPLSSNADLIHQRNLVDSSVIDLQHFAYYFLLGSCILRKKT